MDMDVRKLNKFTSCGGCTAKLPQGMLKDVISKIPVFSDENLLVGFDTSDDGAVYKLSDDLAIIQTLVSAHGGRPLSLWQNCRRQRPERYLRHGQQGALNIV